MMGLCLSKTLIPWVLHYKVTKKSDDDDVLIPATPEPSSRDRRRSNYRTSGKNLELLFSTTIDPEPRGDTCSVEMCTDDAPDP